MTKEGESWMPRRAGPATLGLTFRVPLACAPGGSAPPFGAARFEQDGKVIDRIAAAQREELEQEIATLQAEAERVKMEIVELVGDVPF
jgi:hypothetical protein